MMCYRESLFGRFKLLNIICLWSFFTVSISTSQEIINQKLDSLYQLTLAQMQSDNYYESLKTIYQIREIATQNNLNSYKADADNLFGLAYVQHYAYEKAENHFYKAIDSNKKRNDSVSLAINYANLLHMYVLAKNYDKYNAYIGVAKKVEASIHHRNRFYYYETDAIRLYDLKKYDSLIYVSKKALDDIKNNPYFSVYTDAKKRAAVKYRLEVTFELFLAYAFMEKNIENADAYALLNSLEKIKLDEVLWYSPRVFEHISRVRAYKELYHIRQKNINIDSVLYYKNAAAKYAEKANDLLKEKSAENNQYVINSINKEEELKRIQIVNENQASENALIKKINYLFISLSIIAFFFLMYYYFSSKKLRQINNDLQKLQANRNKFLGIVSHEIRTPLYALQELITKLVHEQNEQNQEEIAYIHQSIINLKHAIDNSLQFSRFNYFGIDIKSHNREVNLIELIKEIQQYFTPILQLHTCDIEIRHRLKNQEFILDEAKIGMVLRNLLKNAIEAPDVSKIVFEVRELVISDTTSEIVLSIEDNGHGIPEKALNDIANQRILLPDENKHKGIRLGLILCNQILSLYDTQLSFHKIENAHQVSFSLVLEKAAMATSKRQSQISQNGNSKRVLFVDDNKVNLLITKKIVESLSLECDTANTGHAAIQKVTTQNYSLILMDLNMPDMDGFETTEAIKKLQPSIPVVAYTALSQDEVATKCSAVGIDEILTKPMQKQELQRILTSLLIVEVP